MSLFEELKKKITGTKKPTKSRLYLNLFLGIILFILGFYGNELLSYINSSPEFYVEKIQPYLEEDFNGQYLPIYLSNIGDKSLHNVKVSISTCYLNSSKNYDLSLISRNSPKALIKFFDLETIRQLKSKDCSLRDQNTIPTCNISFFSYNNQRFVPEQNCTFYLCSPCEYTVNISGENYNNTFTEAFLAPFEYVFLASTVEDKENFKQVFANTSENSWNDAGGIIISMLGQNEECAKTGGNCDFKKGFMNWDYLFEVEPYPKDPDSFKFVLRQKYPNDFVYLRDMKRKGFKII